MTCYYTKIVYCILSNFLSASLQYCIFLEHYNAYLCNATICNSVNFDFPSQKIYKIILLKNFHQSEHSQRYHNSELNGMLKQALITMKSLLEFSLEVDCCILGVVDWEVVFDGPRPQAGGPYSGRFLQVQQTDLGYSRVPFPVL